MTISPHEPPLDLPYPGAPMRAAFRRFWKKGFTFTGRASPSEYWKAWLATTGIAVALYVLSSIVSAAGLAAVMNSGNYSAYSAVTGFSTFLLVVAFLYALAVAIPSIAVAVRRLHDTNQSGAMYLLTFLPFVGGLILLIMLTQASRPEGARFDLATTTPPASPPVPSPPTSTYGEIAAFPVPPVPPAPVAAAVPVPVPPVPSVPVAPAPVPPTPVPPAAVSLPIAPAPVAGIPGIPGVSAPTPAPVLSPASDLESTRLVPPSSVSGWTLDLPDGRSLPVDGAVSFGRDPVSDHGGVLVPVDDPARSMSKTHARFDFAGGAVMVTDLHSTNGTRVEAPGVPAVSVAPGLSAVVPAGATVFLGDYRVRLRRA
ncbi:DUF805 domain-containing protein [Microbacterium sp. B19]|uniref:DUF805 domain-containing protein n=1 Tax=Microbacterium sp. B19 TaxID=96765 RepID=UPI0003451F77|nr:DUF805 domain-containing protein [Microbacterium sp. B19]